MSGLYADIDGQGGLEAIRMAIADFGGKVNGKPIELVYADHQNKADIAASRAREWIDRDGVNVIIGGTNSATALSTNAGRRREEDAVHQHRRGRGQPDQRAVHAVHGPLRVRHDGAREGHRFRGDEAGRQDVVLPDRRLRVRQGAGKEHVGRGEGERRPGARRSASSAVGVGLLVVPVAGARVEGAGARPRQRGRRHDQLDQGRQGIRHHQDDEDRGAADLHHRHPQPGTRNDARPRRDGQLVLEQGRRRRASGRSATSTR